MLHLTRVGGEGVIGRRRLTDLLHLTCAGRERMIRGERVTGGGGVTSQSGTVHRLLVSTTQAGQHRRCHATSSQQPHVCGRASPIQPQLGCDRVGLAER